MWTAIAVLLIGYLVIRLSTAGALGFLVKKLEDLKAQFDLDKEWMESKTKIILEQKAQVEKKLRDSETKIENQLSTVRALTERIHDPKWMEKFSEGRDNAPWN